MQLREIGRSVGPRDRSGCVTMATRGALDTRGPFAGTRLIGPDVDQALQIARETSGNAVVGRAMQDVHDAVKEGEGMSRPLQNSGVFPPIVISMVEVGEETGALPNMLTRISDVYEEEVDRAVEGLTAILEPMTIVLLAVVVGTIVIAMFLPLIKLIENLGGPAG